MRLVVSLLVIAAAGIQAQTLEVNPQRVPVDEPASIRAAGLQPGERVSIRAELVDGADARWASKADFVADEKGAIVAGMSLVSSMMPVTKTARYQPPANFGIQTIGFHLMRRGAAVTSATLEQAATAEGVERVPVHDGPLRGVLFLPPGKERHPGVLVLGGSEGGMPTRRAAWLASHGFAALALAYVRYDDLPKLLEGIPLEYFGQALNWMAHRPEIEAEHMAVMGTSRGAELALQLGSMYPAVKAVVAYAPSNARNPACCGLTAVPYAWTWKGNGLAFRPRPSAPGFAGRAAIQAELTQGPIMLISGDADGVWQSSLMADLIVSRLKQARFAYTYEHLKYGHAGHGVGRPEIVPAWQGAVMNPTSGRETVMGGTPKGNAESSLDAPPKVLYFLRQSLAVK